MVDIKPLKGLIFNSKKIDDISKVVSPPYDVIHEEMKKELLACSNNNIVNLILPGGEGDLKISFDLDDPLSANIVILARPRGKQLGALELLSAGEKALTAIALLFSIYQEKPSPFCILDEVDAPLDEINIGRFLELLRELCNQTQFVLITHNQQTMRNTDVLHGVTMQESGISKIVSIRLNEKGEEMMAA